MPTCQNCGAHVSRDYVRVHEPADVDAPRACPHCPDLVRKGAEVRDRRS